MKKTIAIFVAVMTVFCLLAGCAKESEPDPNAGLYKGTVAEALGLQLEIDDVFEGGMSIELKNGGKAQFNYEGKSYNLKWTLDGTTFHAEGGGAELDGTLSDGTMVLENILDSGVNITLERDAQ